MPSKTKVFVVTSLALTTALSLAILGLSARHISFIANHQRNHVGVRYYIRDGEGPRWESRSDTIWYLPEQWTMRDVHALLVVGLLGAVFGVVNLGLSMRQSGLSVVRKDGKTSGMALTTQTAILAFNSTITLALLVATGISWHQRSLAGILLLGRDYLVLDGAHNRYTNPSQSWNFEAWNCALAPRLRPDSSVVSENTLRSLCRPGKSVRIMVLPALLLSVVTLSLHLWAWRKHTKAIREYGEAAPPYDQMAAVRQKEADLEAQSQDSRSPVSPLSPINPFNSPAAEMANEEKARAELQTDSRSLKEMMGEGGSGELEGGVAAVEKSAT